MRLGFPRTSRLPAAAFIAGAVLSHLAVPLYRQIVMEYLEECGVCSRRAECGGSFSSSVLYRRSKHIRPFKEVRSQ